MIQWQRAETLGALVNGVFLVALCLSIFLEAIQRFVEVQEVSNPKLVMIVGCCGLASNILGLFLFHDHGHSHGGHDHSHSHDGIKDAEEGHSHSHSHTHTHEVGHGHSLDEETRLISNEGGTIEDALPQVRIAGYKGKTERKDNSRSAETNSSATLAASKSPYKRKSVPMTSEHSNKSRRRASIYGGSVDNMPVHPMDRRLGYIYGSQYDDEHSDAGTEEAIDGEQQPLTAKPTDGKSNGYGSMEHPQVHEDRHAGHKHRQPKEQKASGGGHGHSHGDLNMRGVFLHVMGDALGNIGVIGSALIIWLSSVSWRFYFDPGISLVITIIILWSAIPLCKAASRILLQAVPSGLSIDEITSDIRSLEGVDSTHDLHVWQLSDTKVVASVHVKVRPGIKGTGSEGYMRLAREIRQCLQEYGIRNATIQPEFMEDGEIDHDGQHEQASSSSDHSEIRSEPEIAQALVKKAGSKAPSLRSKASDNRVCMLDCETTVQPQVQLPTHDDHEHDHSHTHTTSKHKDSQQK